MSSTTEPQPALRPAAPTSLAVDNLRAVVILLVLAFHSALAYLQFLPHHPFPFTGSPMGWRAFPVVDEQRWLGFDLFCAWLDVCLMSFFFMLSGLFAWSSLTRKGGLAFLGDRLLRLGLPFAVVILFLMPVTQYPTYLQSTPDPSLLDYWHKWQALSIWPNGPVWFLWLLLAGDIMAAILYEAMTGRRDVIVRLSAYARQQPARFLSALLALSAFGYTALALRYGTQDWVQSGPFALQLCRPLHYTVYFLGGVVVGACGIERGLLAADGPVARNWKRWLVAAPLTYFLWAGMTGLVMNQGDAAPLALQTVADVSYAAACFASCFMAFGVAVHFARRRFVIADSLKDNAYGMYLVHYFFVVWLQYALLAFTWPAIFKWAMVFGGTVAASWMVTTLIRRNRLVGSIIGAHRKPAIIAVRPVTPPTTSSTGLAR